MDIKKYIPKGHENAVSIDTLMAMTGMSNRQVRRAIAESDAIILNMQDGKGYFRMNPRTKAERAFAEKYSAQEKSRGWNVLKKAFRIDKKMNEYANVGQMYKFARMLTGMSKSEIANAIGVKEWCVTEVEEGRIVPDDEYKEAFEKVVGLKL